MKSVSSGFVLTSPRSAFCADVIFGGNCDENVGGSEAPSTSTSTSTSTISTSTSTSTSITSIALPVQYRYGVPV